MNSRLRETLRDDEGGAIIEYALVMSLVSIVALTALTGFGDVLRDFFAQSSTQLGLVAQQAK